MKGVIHMKIICNKSNLVKGVSTVSKAVPSKTTMPILECILIDATNDIIRLTANDMELGIQTDIEGEIIDRGMIAIDAKIFSEIVRKLPELQYDKELYVFSSHAHHDHYTKDIFKLENKCKKVVYVLSSDIKRASSFWKKA